MDDFAHRPGAALVLGASGGLGQTITRMLLERGSHVAMTYFRSAGPLEPLRAVAKEHDRTAKAWQLDLSDAAQTAEVVTETAAAFGGIHTLVYAAGPHVPMVHLSKVTPADFRRQLSADTAAFFNAAHAALPHLRAVQGTIVAVTTAATARFPVRDSLSSAPKAAVEALVRAIAAEEGRFGVRANCVGPGMTTDGMAVRLFASGEFDEHAREIARGNIPLGRFGDAEDIAEAVCFLASDRAGYISGQKLDVDGGYSA
ncbi:SDR family NAD(P)-dependent oxidoreductase [Nocardia goodfellowii]|uniref:NAD(P)-dependent dehydrogenase (Short-subunit alcohol dehydrogenase family) n=1 Tax=Nocardia goodfellowii TaxID=882446 RepID=A0ABS4QDI2_9NOCA|nr:SDR family oxidoreductase [Nocardia goodfellowii]MBP2189751.1 NAD(P)-dependent dehydrogenase (short-subunit alcohol dehydrogenase family) [Nocardia goodfellowii]